MFFKNTSKTNETKVIVRIKYKVEIDDKCFGNYDQDFLPCECPADFERTLQSIDYVKKYTSYAVDEEFGINHSKQGKYFLQLELTGKLHGEHLSIKFNDLNSYIQFLNKHELRNSEQASKLRIF